MVVLNRIPYQYFIAKGAGSSPYEIHAGSYHMALFDAGISDYNIQTYSSVLPAIATEVSPKLIKIPFGSELYTIMSCIHGKKNEYISCGIITGDLFDNDTRIGGLVCEVAGDYDEQIELIDRLEMTIDDLHQKTYYQYTLSNLRSITHSFQCNEAYGSCLVAMCFVSFQNVT